MASPSVNSRNCDVIFSSPSSLQLVLFGLSNQVVVTFKEENTMTFKHLFLKDYDESSDDSFAVYTQNDVYDHIFYAIEQVNLEGNGKPNTCI